MEIHRDNITRKKLEIFLQNLSKPEIYNISLEQYPTDSVTASTLLWNAFYDGNIFGKTVMDLGTGNGILAIGAKYLGASEVTGIDKDPKMIDLARVNAIKSNLNVNFVNMDINEITGKYETVIMNPPYGSIIKHSDLPFIDTAFIVGNNIYGIHNYKSLDFLKDYYNKKGEIKRIDIVDVNIPMIYPHHKNKYYGIKSVVFSAVNK